VTPVPPLEARVRRVADAATRSSAVWADRRLGTYAVLAAVGLVLGLVSGEVSYVAAAAPAALLLAGAGRGRAPAVTVMVAAPPSRVLEGDAWVLELRLVWSGRATVDVVHRGIHGHRHDGAPQRRCIGDGGARVRLPVTAERWGRHGLGELRIRARRPGGFIVHDLDVKLPGVVRVLPSATRLDALLRPAQPRAASGAHAASHRAPGTDFAELRPYVAGDRLRDVSWAASARSDDPWVVLHHPDRTGTVVLVLDGFTEVGVPPAAVDRAARVVWSIARHHLDAGDRVGLVAAGPVPRWLSPTAGRRARWLVLDALLRADPSQPVPRSRPHASSMADEAVPSNAVVVGVSSLQSDAFVATMAHHRRLGRPAGVVVVALEDLLPSAADDAERAARRMWAWETDARRQRLTAMGVRCAPAGAGVAAAVRILGAPAPGLRG
jgi:uncharacterized protein (DUF58 family)